MTNDLARIKVPALPDDFNTDWADAYIEDEGGPEAEFLRFNSKEGIWVYGSENTEMPCGTRFLALMDFMRRGLIKFNGPGNEPDKAVAYAAKPKIERESLGDLDESQWSIVNGEPKDPWQEYREVDLYDLATGQQYTLTAASIGGVQAVKRLVDRYRNGRHQHPDQLPIVELQKSDYLNKKLNVRVNTPVLKLVGWQANTPPEAATKAKPEFDDEIPY